MSRRWGFRVEVGFLTPKVEAPSALEGVVAPNVPGEFERHAMWAAHTRWVVDHYQHRLEMAGQQAIGVVGIQGVLVALVAGFLDLHMKSWEAWCFVGALITLLAGMGTVTYEWMPRGVPSIAPTQHRIGWKREVSDNPWYSPEEQFVEELLQGHTDATSPLEGATKLIDRRLRGVKFGLILTAVAMVLVVVGTLGPVIGELL